MSKPVRIWIWLGVWLLACTPQKSAEPTPQPPQEPRTAAPAVPDFSNESRGIALERDPLWAQAALGDPLDLARLAQREGARGLLNGAEQGGRVGLTALRALPEADDGELALERLCGWLDASEPQRLEALLRSVQGVLGRPPANAEVVAVAGFHRCQSVLTRLRGSSAVSAGDRDLSSAALAGLAERGVN